VSWVVEKPNADVRASSNSPYNKLLASSLEKLVVILLCVVDVIFPTPYFICSSFVYFSVCEQTQDSYNLSTTLIFALALREFPRNSASDAVMGFLVNTRTDC